MGIFGDTPHEHGTEGLTWLVRPELQSVWGGQSGFEAMGHVVPFFRRRAAYKHLRLMGFTDKEETFSLVEMMSDRIARDDTHGAMEAAYKRHLDVTGIYRIISVLLCDPPEEEEQNVAEASYLDLVS